MKREMLGLFQIAFMAIALVSTACFAQPPLEWAARYDGPGHGHDAPVGVGVDASGNVYVAGLSTGSGTASDYATVKYNSGGVQQWENRYDAVGAGGFDTMTDMCLDAAGNVYVTGTCDFNPGPTDICKIVTIKYNAAGDQLWIAAYQGGSEDSFSDAIAVDANGNVYVAGGSYQGGGYSYITIKYNNSGTQQWTAVYSGPVSNGYDWARAIAVDQSGNVYVTGESPGIGTDLDYATVKYNSAGAQQWVARYDGPGHGYDAPLGVGVDASGNVYVAGVSTGSGTGSDYATVKYNSAGVRQWDNRYDAVGAGGFDTMTDMCLDAAGNVYVTGTCDFNPGPTDICKIVTIKYNAAGDQLWVATYQGGAEDSFGYALAVDAYGNVDVAGKSYPPGSGYDYITINYNSAGAQQWWAFYAGPVAGGEDEPSSITVDGSGSIYVTGKSIGSGTEFDFATIKYSQTENLTVNLIPFSSNIQIPASGGSFEFYVFATNSGSDTAWVDLWTKVTFPGGSTLEPLLGPANVLLSPGTTGWYRVQNVPGHAPAGTYAYVGCLGDYPNSVWATDTFPFVKAAGDDGAGIDNWDNWGDPFNEQANAPASPPATIVLHKPVPDPFNPTTALSFELRAASLVKLAVFDISGRTVTTLADGWRETGTHQITFDGTGLPSGIYIYRLLAAGSAATGKMVLLK